MENQSKVRNSLIEILRLFAALWVCYYHGITLIERGAFFGNGRIAVDFFFILSGFFLLKSLKSFKEKSLVKGSLNFVWKRLKPMLFTFSICMVFSLIYFFSFELGGEYSSPFGYLWYIPYLLVIELCYYVCKRLVKKDWIFYIIIAVFGVAANVLIFTRVTDFGMIRALACLPIGIFVSLIPKITVKNSTPICIVSFLAIFAAIFAVSYIAPEPKIEDPILILVLFPSILYFANQIEFKNKYVNLVCSISLGLYCYQAVVRYFERTGQLTSPWVMFLIVLGLAILDVAIRKAYFVIKNKNKTRLA